MLLNDIVVWHCEHEIVNWFQAAISSHNVTTGMRPVPLAAWSLAKHVQDFLSTKSVHGIRCAAMTAISDLYGTMDKIHKTFDSLICFGCVSAVCTPRSLKKGWANLARDSELAELG